MLHFTTPAGAHYFVNEKGQIGRTRANGQWPHEPGPGWTLEGIASVPRGFCPARQVLAFEDLTPEVVRATQWRYRTSGNPRFTVVDCDHGTRRIWGTQPRHGIRSMWYEDDDPATL